ncbi:hypothetical protein G1H11_08730 [Phytoactinopolyspora alkaliphila]|uniref:Uncharacterized protein n=1 Tax=Phytoactinopolyspora alkaliphila TaxID=1783498 RepID=A0A6N9YKK1_9ACTN|nr:hypothetical protein [Phytoactinopolyspora alkaliphila]NED95398.1 hypothetical protein [Phytoactinopolyspora alkaliphila]
MSGTFDVKSLPLYRQIALFGGALLFISLFLPWWRVSITGGPSGSESGWNGLGTLAGLLVILLIAWEVLRVLGQAAQVKFNQDLITAALAGLIALFGVIQFIRALTYGGGIPSGFGVSAGPGFGAYLILVFSLALGYAAYLAFQAAGGPAALKEAQSQVQGNKADTPEPAAAPVSEPRADVAPPAAETAPPAPPAEDVDASGTDEERPPGTPAS